MSLQCDHEVFVVSCVVLYDMITQSKKKKNHFGASFTSVFSKKKILIAVDQHTNIGSLHEQWLQYFHFPNEHGSVVSIVSSGASLVSKLMSLHVSGCVRSAFCFSLKVAFATCDLVL